MRDILVVAATVLIAAAAPRADAAAENQQTEYKFEIPRQPLSQAAHELAIVTDSDFTFFPESRQEDAMLVGPIEGTYTADAALKLILEPIGYAHEWLGERSFHIYKKETESNDAAPNSGEAQTSASLKRRWPGGKSQYDDIDFVIVIGTRIPSVATEAQSVAVVDGRKIDSYGVSTLAELFEYLPQVPFVRPEYARPGGEQFADLRGLGSGTTMILINGRRITGTATSFDVGGFDVNTIPLTAVQRVEVLLDAPSVVIGTDTIAGVINVVLKDEIPQPTVQVRFGAAEGGAEEGRVSAGIGTSRESFRGMTTFDLFQRKPLLGAERELMRDQDYRRFGGVDYRSLDSNPGNVFSLTPANLPGLDSPFAAVPKGTSGVDLTPRDFTATAGQLNRTSLSRFLSVVPEVTRLSLITSAELQLSPSIVAFAEAFGANSKVEQQTGPPTLTGSVVPAANAFNPFDAPVAINTLLEGGPIQAWMTDATFLRGVGGIRGQWNEWAGEFGTAWIEDRAKSWRDNELDFTRVTYALGSSDPNSALNVFSDGPAGTRELLASLVATPMVRRLSSSSLQAYAHAERQFAAWSAGDIRVLFGGEWRQEEMSNPALPTDPVREVAAAFAEVHVPLVGAEMNIPYIRHLAVSLSSRNDHYSGLESRSSVQYGLVLRPTEHFKLRASYSDNFRPPLLYELHGPRISTELTLPDPQRGGEPSTFIATFGGNTNLRPTVGYTWTTGLDYIPHELPQLHVSIGYWKTTLTERIAPLSLFAVLAEEELFPGAVGRASPSPTDLYLGLPGEIQTVDASWGNYGKLRASGFDINVSFRWDSRMGRFSHDLSAVWNDTYETVLVTGAPADDRIGIASELGTIPRWRAVASTAWNRGPLTTLVVAQFVSAYEDAVEGEATGRTIPGSMILDAQASLRLGELVPSTSFMSSVELTVGVKNLLDETPHFAEAGYALGHDFYQSDLRQRFWYLALAKEF